MNGGSGRSSLGSESPLISLSKPNHMRDTINGQRATIAKLFEQGNTGLTFQVRRNRSMSVFACELESNLETWSVMYM